jgi:tellurite resistance protein TerC
VSRRREAGAVACTEWRRREAPRRGYDDTPLSACGHRESMLHRRPDRMPALSLPSIALFGVLVVFFLWLDLFAHRGATRVPLRSALGWSLLWVSLALGFAAYLGTSFGRDRAWLFLTGYLLEQSLSVDNLFVFIAIFASFAIRDSVQHRILYYGILGAIVLRFVFIGLGTTLLVAGEMHALMHTAVYALFGVLVLVSAYQMFRAVEDGDGEIEDYTDHWSVRWARKLLPVHPQLEGAAFFARRDGRWLATPLFLCLVTVEASDLAFAFDSVPAVIAVTREPFLVYSSNIFAILGLRSMFFLLSAARRYLCHLEKAVVAILVFIGVKLLVDAFHTQLGALLGRPVEISASRSLVIVLVMLGAGVLASLLFPTPHDADSAP